MTATQIEDIAAGLVSRGRAVFRLTAAQAAAFSRLDAAAGRFFGAPQEVLRLSLWPGHGMWAGYQPMPDGDAEVIDQVDRFEVSLELLDRSDAQWPWGSAEARALKQALRAVNAIARDLIAAAVGAVAQLSGREPDAARRLWCEDDASTLVVNAYRSWPAGDTAATGGPAAVKMKPHADFGGLSLIQAGRGLDALQFRAGAGADWEPVTEAGGGDGLAVMLTGQLFAHWLGTQAPVHRVVHDPGQARMSTVYFHQPNLAAVIPGQDAEPIVAGEHIAAMQDFYNSLGVSPA
jgi:isopenicillin N synthase-like dioxygenase